MNTQYIPTHIPSGRKGPPMESATAASIFCIMQPEMGWEVKPAAPEPTLQQIEDELSDPDPTKQENHRRMLAGLPYLHEASR